MLVERDDDLAVVWTMLLEWLGADVVRLSGDGAPARRDHEVLICEPSSLSQPWLRSLAAAVPTILTDDCAEPAGARVLTKPIHPSVLSRAILAIA
ncbi:MAG: hypothetical protein ACXVDD_27400 [Polyangia bacterium]